MSLVLIVSWRDGQVVCAQRAMSCCGSFGELDPRGMGPKPVGGWQVLCTCSQRQQTWACINNLLSMVSQSVLTLLCGMLQGGQADRQCALLPGARGQPEAHRFCSEQPLRRRPPWPRQAEAPEVCPCPQCTVTPWESVQSRGMLCQSLGNNLKFYFMTCQAH